MKLNFIKDAIFNSHSGILDHNGIETSENYRISHNLNQSSGFVNFKSGSYKNLYCVTDQNNTVPEQIYVKASFLSGYQYDLDFDLSINNIPVYNETFNVSGPYELVDGEYQKSHSGYFTPTEAQLNNLLTNKNLNKSKIKHDVVKIGVESSNPTPNLDQKLRRLEIDFSGQTYSSYSSLTPEINTFHPTAISGLNINNSLLYTFTDPAFVSGLTNSSSRDSSWIYNEKYSYLIESGIVYNPSYIDFYFNSNNELLSKKIDKCVFSIRVNNSSGDISNNQEWSSLSLFSSKINNAIGFGSGFHIHNTSGFTKIESNISFVNNGRPSDYYATSDLLDDFVVRMYQPPKDTKISAVQLDVYSSNDDMFAISLPCKVHSKKDTIRPKDPNFFNTGKNRLKQSGFDENFFNLFYRPLNSGDSISKNLPAQWGNYYNSKISTYEYSQHNYNNHLFLEKNGYIIEEMDNDRSFTFFINFSTSGNFDYLKSDYNSVLFNKYTVNQFNQSLTENFRFVIRDDEVFFAILAQQGPFYGSFNSANNTKILITNQRNGPIDNFNIYVSLDDLPYSKIFNINKPLLDGVGPLYIGGSGVNDFEGYVHEYGFSNQYLDESGVVDFYNSRHNISKVLSSGNFLEFNEKNIYGTINDNFFINLEPISDKNIYQNHPSIFNYNTLLTSPRSYIINLDYDFYSNHASGIIVSGYYNESFSQDGQEIKPLDNIIKFEKNIKNGSGVIELPISTYAKDLIIPQKDSHYNTFLNLYLSNDFTKGYGEEYYSPFEEEYYNEEYILKDYRFIIKDVSVTFDGWYINPTGVQTLNFVTNGYTYEDDSLDFYLNNSYNSGTLDFYIRGRELSNNYLNFYSNASILEFSSLTLNSFGQLISNESFDLYTSGPEVQNHHIDFTIEGTPVTEYTDEVNLFLYSNYFDLWIPEDEWNPSGYWISEPGSYQTSNFFMNLESSFDPNNQINLFIGSSEEELEDSINLIMPSDNIEGDKFNLYIQNDQSNTNYELDFFINSTYNSSGNINMFTKGL